MSNRKLLIASFAFLFTAFASSGANAQRRSGNRNGPGYGHNNRFPGQGFLAGRPTIHSTRANRYRPPFVPGWYGGIYVNSGGCFGEPAVVIVDGGYCSVPGYYVDVPFYKVGYKYYPPGYVYGGMVDPNSYRQTTSGYDGGNTQATVATASCKSQEDVDEYYLNKPVAKKTVDSGLEQTVADIENAFKTRNGELLSKHLRNNKAIVLQTKGNTRKSIRAADYLEMTRQAFVDSDTVDYSLNHIEPASGGATMAWGSHVLKGEDGREKVYRVGFVLSKVDGVYYITETSAELMDKK